MKKLRRTLRIAAVLYLLAWFMGGFWFIAVLKSDTLHRLAGIDVDKMKDYLYYALAGAIGGTLYALRILHEFYYRINVRWLIWYLLRPFLCAGTAVMTIVLFQSGILLLQVGDTASAKIGVAFLVGYGFGKCMDKLKTLTEVLFNGKSDPPQGGKENAK
ncbi:hypothetical protein [Paenibacillus hamazuiensis]|uniref:hypothetical protein n=1 Tax=Paenibacillus hamazuiensis TaxID=2936508 RepID=UPI00200EDFBF|nr:hypothetical protein [Paenibacillus hamazuiensis]